MFQSVTVGLDGTRESFAAVAWAAREALARGVPLQLVQVRDTGSYPYSPLADEDVEREWARTVTEQALDELNRRAPDLHTDVELTSGRPAHVLADLSSGTDLLVLGSRGLSPLLGFIVGSTAMPTVAHSACPVVLVRARPADGQGPGQGPAGEPLAASDAASKAAMEAAMETATGPEGDIVLGLDLERPCDELIGFAFDSAARHSSALRVLHAWDLPPTYGVRPFPVPPSMTREMLAAQNKALADALRPWQERHPDIKVHAEAEIGHPSRLLVEAAAQASLLVIGRRNRHSRIGTHLGPVDHAVLHHARTPVAVVPYG